MSLTRKVGLAAGGRSLNQPRQGERADISDFRPSMDAVGLYVNNDVNHQLIDLIERLFCQHTVCDRDRVVEVSLSDIEYDILNIVCTGRRMTAGELMRECLQHMSGKYHRLYRDTGRNDR